MSNSVYKHFVVLAVLAFWPTAIYMAHRWRIGRHSSFSHHAASEKRAYYMFAVAISLESILYLLFGYKWLVPTFNMPFVFGALLGLAIACHWLSGLVPETKGWAYIVHRRAAYGVAALFLPLLALIVLQSSVGLFARTVALIFLIIDGWIGYLYLRRPKMQDNFLIYEVVYIASMPLVMLAITYIR